jgi:hypothetical protein
VRFDVLPGDDLAPRALRQLGHAESWDAGLSKIEIHLTFAANRFISAWFWIDYGSEMVVASSTTPPLRNPT